MKKLWILLCVAVMMLGAVHPVTAYASENPDVYTRDDGVEFRRQWGAIFVRANGRDVGRYISLSPHLILNELRWYVTEMNQALEEAGFRFVESYILEFFGINSERARLVAVPPSSYPQFMREDGVLFTRRWGALFVSLNGEAIGGHVSLNPDMSAWDLHHIYILPMNRALQEIGREPIEAFILEMHGIERNIARAAAGFVIWPQFHRIRTWENAWGDTYIESGGTTFRAFHGTIGVYDIVTDYGLSGRGINIFPDEFSLNGFNAWLDDHGLVLVDDVILALARGEHVPNSDMVRISRYQMREVPYWYYFAHYRNPSPRPVHVQMRQDSPQTQHRNLYVRNDGAIFELWHDATTWFFSIGFSLEHDTSYSVPTRDFFHWQRSLDHALAIRGFSPMEQSLVDWATHRSQSLPTHSFAPYHQFNRAQHTYITAITNGAWVNAAENFIRTQVRPATRHNFPNPQGDRQVWPALNHQLSIETRDMVQSAFASDEIRHVMPFNTQFWNTLTSRPNYYFWVFRDGDGFGGLYGGRRVGVSINPSNRANYQWNAGTLAHEIGHHLGLGEHLAHFFDEAISPVAGRGSWDGLYRNSTMDWIIMEQAGQVEFMRAIFWGDDTYYRKLWDNYIYPIMGITYENMQLARAASEQDLGRWRSASNNIAEAFEGAFDASLSQARRNQHINLARQNVNNMASWARGLNLQPYGAFLAHRDGIPTRETLVPIN